MDSTKEVYFHKYCSKCLYKNEDPDTGDHCDECLDNPVNIDSHKPVMFKPEKDEVKEKRGRKR